MAKLDNVSSDPKTWASALVAYVRQEVPGASAARLLEAAFALHSRFGMFDPTEVAEVEWYYLPLEGDMPLSSIE